MSVDTYLRKKTTAGYQFLRQNGVEIMVALALPRVAKDIHVGLKKFLFLKSFSIQVESKEGHAHGPACKH